MPKEVRKDQWESPQQTPDQLSTPMLGGSTPSKEDVVRSANARAQKRHDMKGQKYADVGVLPDSDEMVNNELVGVKDHGYLVKKNTPWGVTAFFNTLPPGEDIEDQEMCDIREMEMRVYERGLGYPGDGWVTKPKGAAQIPGKMDTGRADKTNYGGGAEE